MNIYIYITTNGVLLTKERANAIVEAGIDSIKFSINGANRKDYLLMHGKDEFDKVIENVVYLHSLKEKYKRKISLYISYIITKYTGKEKDYFKQKYSRYVDDIVFYDCQNVAGCMTKEVEEYLSVDGNTKYKTNNNICPIIFKNLYITFEGYLTMCCIDFQNYLVVADLKKEKIEDAWNNSYAQQLRRCHLEHKLEECFVIIALIIVLVRYVR